MPLFQLDKWYFDCVTDAGDAIVLYRASLKWGILRLSYGAVLYHPRRGDSLHRYTLRPGTEANVDDNAIQWVCPRLAVAGVWIPGAPGFKCKLLDSADGAIHWHCLAPQAYADVRLGSDRLTGRGYVEQLTMTVTPWRLPFSELKWGRFVGRNDSLVWIQWLGPTIRTWVWLNGTEHLHGSVIDERIELPHEHVALNLQNDAVLRTGLLSSTALRSIRALTCLMPQWRGAHETKWLAHGTLNRPGGADTGWAIHESVRWM